MTRIEVELLGNAPNAAVVLLPGRRFPGVVIQGDSLSILVATAYRVKAELASAAAEAATDELSELCQLLDAYLQQYEAAMRVAGLDLPYVPGEPER